jgi:hypothetical protein
MTNAVSQPTAVHIEIDVAWNHTPVGARDTFRNTRKEFGIQRKDWHLQRDLQELVIRGDLQGKFVKSSRAVYQNCHNLGLLVAPEGDPIGPAVIQQGFKWGTAFGIVSSPQHAHPLPSSGVLARSGVATQ